MSNPPFKIRVRVERVYFYSKVQLAVVGHEAGEDIQLDEWEQDERVKVHVVKVVLSTDNNKNLLIS